MLNHLKPLQEIMGCFDARGTINVNPQTESEARQCLSRCPVLFMHWSGKEPGTIEATCIWYNPANKRVAAETQGEQVIFRNGFILPNAGKALADKLYYKKTTIQI